MRQIWISKVGPPEVLVIKEAADPQPGSGELRIRVEASGVNFADVMGRLGLYPDLPKIPVVPGYEVAVLSDELRPLPPRAVGEIGVRGSGLFSAYYAPWTLREAIERDGWFMTGDIGSLDEDGALQLAGRKKAVIFVAGLKFFPEEVEDCINQVRGVVESRVFGRPHPRLGEVPCAEVVFASGRGDIAALKAHCARLLSPYKVPHEFSTVDAVPRTPGGKIMRRGGVEGASLAPEA